jgi:hypothetical protein
LQAESAATSGKSTLEEGPNGSNRDSSIERQSEDVEVNGDDIVVTEDREGERTDEVRDDLTTQLSDYLSPSNLRQSESLARMRALYLCFLSTVRLLFRPPHLSLKQPRLSATCWPHLCSSLSAIPT